MLFLHASQLPQERNSAVRRGGGFKAPSPCVCVQAFPPGQIFVSLLARISFLSGQLFPRQISSHIDVHGSKLNTLRFHGYGIFEYKIPIYISISPWNRFCILILLITIFRWKFVQYLKFVLEIDRIYFEFI